jgi:hypothetical protein
MQSIRHKNSSIDDHAPRFTRMLIFGVEIRIGFSPFKIKLILSILWLAFKVDKSNDIKNFTLFKFFKKTC